MIYDDSDLKKRARFIGSRIKQARKKEGLTQEELAEKLGKQQNAISKYESGDQDFDAVDLPDFARVLNVPITYFFGDNLPDDDLETEILEWVKRLPSSGKQQALTLIQALVASIVAQQKTTSSSVDDLLSALNSKMPQIKASFRSNSDLKNVDVDIVLSTLLKIVKEEQGDGGEDS